MQFIPSSYCTNTNRQLRIPGATDIVLVTVQHSRWKSNCAVHKSLGKWRGDTALTLPLFWRRTTVSPVFFGRFPRSSLSLSRPLPTLSPSLIGHLASVDVKQHESKAHSTTATAQPLTGPSPTKHTQTFHAPCCLQKWTPKADPFEWSFMFVSSPFRPVQVKLVYRIMPSVIICCICLYTFVIYNPHIPPSHSIGLYKITQTRGYK